MFKYFGAGFAILNAANGAILITDQRYWVHFNIFAVGSPHAPRYIIQGSRIVLTIGGIRICYDVAYVVPYQIQGP